MLYLPTHARSTVNGCRDARSKCHAFLQSLPSRLGAYKRSLISGGEGGVQWAPACSCSPNLSQHRHQHWHRHGETWDSLVAALRETKISTRAGIRGHYGKVTFWTG